MQTLYVREFVSGHQGMTDESHIIIGDRPVGMHFRILPVLLFSMVGWLVFIGLAVVVTKAWELL